MKTGLLVTVEGIDGSGKSTLVENIAKQLAQQDIPTLITKEPGSTELGKHIRSFIQNRTFSISSTAEYLLFAADRAEHFEKKVLPALSRGMVVLSDRMADSSLVYQGYARGLDTSMINQINQWTMHKTNPDLTFYLRIDAEESMRRIRNRNLPLTSFEKEGGHFIQTLIDGFDTLFKNKPDGILLNGTDSIESLTLQAMDHLTLCIKNKLSPQKNVEKFLLHNCL